jgi:DDE superfamily endonuclease
MQFIEKCDELRILVLVLPPHSTHRLQPLDVSLFSPLSSYYTNELNQLIFDSLGIINMSKRAFWSVFWPAWKQAFTPQNIASGFAKTGIFPFDPSIVLNAITKPQPIEAPKASISPKTPIRSREVWQIQEAYKNAPSTTLLSKIFRAHERLAAHHDIDQHVVKGLCKALKDEKKRRKRGKRLNILGKEDSGPQFFSPAQVQAGRDWQAQKEEEEAQKQRHLKGKRAAIATQKLQKEEARLQRATQATERRLLAEEMKAAKKVERQAQKELKEAAKGHKKRQLELQEDSTETSKRSKTTKKAKGKGNTIVIAQKAEVVNITTSKGRQIKTPQRFVL